MIDVHHCTHDSPLGTLTLVAGARGLRGLYFDDHRGAPIARGSAGRSPSLDAARRQLDAYFAGRRTAFELALDATGTPFERAVWAALATIPYGTTTTYGTIAQRIGRPTAARAVGAANGRNPLSIIVPCHRVVGQDASLTGYAGGLPRKQALLQLEGVLGKAVVPCQPLHGRC